MNDEIVLQDREIRLLFLLHNECGAEDIDFSLVRTTIDRAPPYEALSYAWGDDECQITLRNGAVATLTSNLYHALRHLQRPHASRLLWVDAVCINQRNDAERSQQAQFMNQIYAMAWRVLVWLGEEGDDTSRAFTILKRGAQAATAPDCSFRSPRSTTLDPEDKRSIMLLIDRP